VGTKPNPRIVALTVVAVFLFAAQWLRGAAAVQCECYPSLSQCLSANPGACEVGGGAVAPSSFCPAYCNYCFVTGVPTVVPTPNPTVEPTWSPTPVNRPTWRNIHNISTQLNGTNGEWTNADDRNKKQVVIIKQKAKPKPKQKRQPRRKNRASTMRKARGIRPVGVSPRLSMCAAKYALACARPFDLRCRGVCMPTFPAVDSFKATAYLELDLVVGTAGYGFASLAPCTANDRTCIWYSSDASTFNGTTMTDNNAQAGVSTALMNTLPYGYTAMVPTDAYNSVQSRIVSAGMEIQYTGTLLNRGGLIYGIATPQHNECSNFSGADIALFPNATVTPDRGQREFITTSSVRPQETQFSAGWFANSASLNTQMNCYFPYYNGQIASGPTTSAAPMMGFLVKGVPGNSYHVRVVVHAEYIGQPVQGRATPSESDQRGFEAVNNAVRDIGTRERATGKTYDPLKEMARLVGIDLGMGSPTTTIMDFANGVSDMAGALGSAYANVRGAHSLITNGY